ncbi:putative AB hydrolase superfamily protein YisY [Candidatus Zixiibacteriota bacterium]|nr:putative AB hydrolase superfamily protein YisY [candidate division Zixibacteria bacterium]
MALFNSNGVNIFYEDGGTGVPLIFLHGFSLDHRMWEKQIEYFSSKYRVITVDARGHGKSDAPESGYAREDRAGDILNLAQYLKLPKFHLIGLSMGGGDALSFAIDYQERLLSLTLADSVAAGYKPKTKFRDYAELFQQLPTAEAKEKFIDATLAYYVDRDPEIRQNLEQMMLLFSGRPLTDPMRGKYPKRDDLRLAVMVRIPVLIIVGKKDLAWLPLAKKLNEVILDSRLEILSGVGHMSNMEAPEKFNTILEEFLSKIKG